MGGCYEGRGMLLLNSFMMHQIGRSFGLLVDITFEETDNRTVRFTGRYFVDVHVHCLHTTCCTVYSNVHIYTVYQKISANVYRPVCRGLESSRAGRPDGCMGGCI